ELGGFASLGVGHTITKALGNVPVGHSVFVGPQKTWGPHGMLGGWRWCLQTERWQEAIARMPDDPTEADLSTAFGSCDFAAISHLRRSAAQTKALRDIDIKPHPPRLSPSKKYVLPFKEPKQGQLQARFACFPRSHNLEESWPAFQAGQFACRGPEDLQFKIQQVADVLSTLGPGIWLRGSCVPLKTERCANTYFAMRGIFNARRLPAARKIDPWSKRWATQVWRYWGHVIRNQLDTPLRFLTWRYSTFTLMSGDSLPGWVVNTPLRKFQLCYGAIRSASHPAIWETAAQERTTWQQLYPLWRRHWTRDRLNTDLLGRQLVIVNLEEAALRPFHFFPDEDYINSTCHVHSVTNMPPGALLWALWDEVGVSVAVIPPSREEAQALFLQKRHHPTQTSDNAKALTCGSLLATFMIRVSMNLRLRYNTFDRQDQQHDLLRRWYEMAALQTAISLSGLWSRMSSLLAARMRLYIRAMRVSWAWFFATLFELEEYASDLDRVLRDFDTLDPDDPPLTQDDVSYMHFLLAEWEVSFDHSCENVVWFFFNAHLPCWRIVGMVHLPHLHPFFALQWDELHQYLEELPALDQCLAAREIQHQLRTCRNTWPEYWFLPALARYIDSHLDVLYEVPLWPYQEPAESFWDRCFDMVGDRLKQEVSELVSRFEMTCEFIAWNELGVHLTP
ncbi:unnamed protein product, partial [Symbiodinium necroappetens]